MDILQIAEGGGVSDKHVERMFHDLYYGTYTEDDITLRNFNLYVEVLYGIEAGIKSFDEPAPLIALIAQAFEEQNYLTKATTIAGPVYRITFKSWGGKTFVQNEKLPIALSLAIVENMRKSIKTKFNGARH